MKLHKIALGVSFLSAALAGASVNGGTLAEDFANPPQKAGVHAWWHWVGYNVSKAGITRDLEAMKAAGSTAPADILAALPSLEVPGLVCGDVSFNEVGDANKTEAFVKKCNTETGAWEFLKKQSAE